MEQSYQNLMIHTVAFPPIQWVSAFYSAANLLVEAHENYQKKSARNRFLLGSHQGVHSLSIPLEKGKNHQKNIMNVSICYQQDWPTQHLRFLQTVYGNSPFYEYYREDLIKLFVRKEKSLFTFNMNALNLLKSWLSIPKDFQMTCSYQKSISSQTLDLRSQSYTDFTQDNPPYEQIFGQTFLHNLSILDAIFHLGPETPAYLKKFRPTFVI
ncbi:MAG: WbqC family protein [Saprospiraceae bacterium]|nr:WbqC family protein [Saprospiraceae bacterium]